MKNIHHLFYLLLYVLMVSCTFNNRQEGILISGSIVQPGENAILRISRKDFKNEKFIIIDSLKVNSKESFAFEVKSYDPGYYQFFYGDNKNTVSALMLIDSVNLNFKIKIDTSYRGSGKNAIKIREIQIKGTLDNELLDGYFGIDKKFYGDYIFPLTDSINLAIQNREDLRLKELYSELNEFNKERIESKKDFLKNRIGTSIAVYQTMNRWENFSDDFIDSIVNRFKTYKKNSFITPLIVDKSKQLKLSNFVNKPTPNFELPNKDDKVIVSSSLSDKKLILLDFWATWCGPCLKEIPAYKDIYNKHKDRFEIVSISIDKSKDIWIKGLNKLKMPWVNLIDIDSKISKIFKISELPTNFLIDSEGIIIKKNISKADLVLYLKNLE